MEPVQHQEAEQYVGFAPGVEIREKMKNKVEMEPLGAWILVPLDGVVGKPDKVNEGLRMEKVWVTFPFESCINR